MTIHNFQRALAFVLALSFGLPGPASALPEPREEALRVSQPRNSPTAAGLEEELSAGLEEGPAKPEGAGDLEAALARLAGNPDFVAAGRSHPAAGNPLQRAIQFELIMERLPMGWPGDSAELAALTGWLAGEGVEAGVLLQDESQRVDLRKRLAEFSLPKPPPSLPVPSADSPQVLTGHTGWVYGVAFSPDGRQLASAGDDHTVRLWDVATGKRIWLFAGHTGGAREVVFSPDGQLLASAGNDGTVRLWEVATGRQLRSFTGHSPSWVLGVAFFPDGRRLVSADGDGAIRLWDGATSRGVRSFSGHVSAVYRVAFSPDGQQLASAGNDGTVRLWDVASGVQKIRSFTGHVGAVYGIAFSPDGQQLASAGNDGTVRLWDVASGWEARSFIGHARPVFGVAFSPDGRRLASAGQDGRVRLWDVATGKRIWLFAGHTGGAREVVFSPDGRQLASAGDDGTVRFWDVAAGPGSSAGLEEDSAKPEEALDPKLLHQMTKIARTLTGRYGLELRPWERLWEGDYPQWRLLPDLNLLQFVPEDLKRFPPAASEGALMEAIASAIYRKPDSVEPEFQANGAFLALLRALEIPWARSQVIARFTGMKADFTRLDQALYPPSSEGEPPAPQPQLSSAFVQFLEGILAEGRQDHQPYTRVTDPLVSKALEETRSLRQGTMELDEQGLYLTVRDHLWPVALGLLAADVRQELFKNLLHEEAARKQMDLTAAQQAQAQAGQLGFQGLSDGQQGIARRLLRDRFSGLSEAAQRALEQVLGKQMADEIGRMAGQAGMGALPPELFTGQMPSPAQAPVTPEQLEQMQKELRERAQRAGELARELASAAERMTADAQEAGSSAAQVADSAQAVRHSAGSSVPLPQEKLSRLPELAQRLQQEILDLEGDGRLFEEQAKALEGQADRMGEDAPKQTEKLRALAKSLWEQAQEIGQAIRALQAAGDQLKEQVDSLVQQAQVDPPDVSSVRDQAREVQAQAAQAAAGAQQIQGHAKEAEKTAAQFAQEVQEVAKAKTPSERILDAAREIAEWANPQLKQAREQGEAWQAAIEELLKKLHGLKAQAGAQADFEGQVDELIRQEGGQLQEALQKLLQALELLQQKQEELGQKVEGKDPQVPKLVIFVVEQLGEAGRQAGQVKLKITALQVRADQLAEALPALLQRAARQIGSQAGEMKNQAQGMSDQIGQLAEGAQQQAQEAGLPVGGPGGGAGIGPSPYRVEGSRLLREKPPEPDKGPAPPETPPPAPRLSSAAEAQRTLKLNPAQWRRRERAARDFQQQSRRVRQPVVERQRPRLNKYLSKRRAMISVARAHLFQSRQMLQRIQEQTDLVEGEDFDEDALALVRTGTNRLMKDTALPGKSKRRRSYVLDVSGSMVNSFPKTPGEGDGLDFALDLLITLAYANSRVPDEQFQITIFSDWYPNPSRVVKKFSEPWNDAVATRVIDEVLNSSHGNTNDVGAVEEEIVRMRQGADPETELTLWVLSDGLSGAGGAASMSQVMLKNPDIRIFGWGLGSGMRAVQKTFGPYGIWVPKMERLVPTGVKTLTREGRRPVRRWNPVSPRNVRIVEGEPRAGLEEAVAADGLPLEFPRLHPDFGRPGAGPLAFHRSGDSGWFEIDGIRIDPPADPEVELSDWTVEKLQKMWDTYRKHPRNRNNLMLVGEAGIGKSLYVRYLWEIYRAWLMGRAGKISDPAVLQRVLEYAKLTQARILTFNENIKKPDMTERLHFGENPTAQEETGWSASDVIEGGELGDNVVLSEVNRATGGVLAELNDPLQSRRKDLHDRTAVFHPNARFTAAINPPEGSVAYLMGYKGRELPGEFTTRFDKLEMNYPPEFLEDGTTRNPEYAKFFDHEQRVLKRRRTRRLADGSWAVSDQTIEALVRFANLMRADARQGQVPFIFTTRALVAIVRHLDKFPEDLARLPDVIFRAYWVDDTVHGDDTEKHIRGIMERLFKPAAWPAGDPWPAPRPPVGEPEVVTAAAGQLSRSFIRYPHWPADVRIPLAPGTGRRVPATPFYRSQENDRILHDLLQDVALGKNILNIGDAETGKNYFMEALAKALRRNLVVVGIGEDFKIRDMLVVRWFSGGRTRWHDSMPLAHMRLDTVLAEGPPLIVLDEGNKGRPGILAAFNDLLADRRIRLASGEDFIVPDGTVFALNMNPPRPPYEVYELSGEFGDRWSWHKYLYQSEDDAVRILQAMHPDLAEAAIRGVVKAAKALHPLYHGGELFEPVWMRMIQSALGFMLQEPERQVNLIDLVLRAYAPLKDGEAAAVRQTLAAAGLDIQVNPSPEAEVRVIEDALGHADPAVRLPMAQKVWGMPHPMPALFSNRLVPKLIDAYKKEGEPAVKATLAAALGKHLPDPDPDNAKAVLSASLPPGQPLKGTLPRPWLKGLYHLFTAPSWEEYAKAVEKLLPHADPRLVNVLFASLSWKRLDASGNPVDMPGDLYRDPRIQNLMAWTRRAIAPSKTGAPPGESSAGLEEEPSPDPRKKPLPSKEELTLDGRREFEQQNSRVQRYVQYQQVAEEDPPGFPGDDAALALFTGWLMARKVGVMLLTDPLLSSLQKEWARIRQFLLGEPGAAGPHAIEGLIAPSGAAYDPVTQSIYVAEEGSSTVQRYSAFSGAFTDRLVSRYGPIEALHFDPATRLLFVVEEMNPQAAQRHDAAYVLEALNTVSGRSEQWIIDGLYKPAGIDFDPASKIVAVAEAGEEGTQVRFWHIPTGEEIGAVPLSGKPAALAIDPVHGMAIYTEPVAGSLSSQHKIKATRLLSEPNDSFDTHFPEVQSPSDLEVDAEGRRLFVLNQKLGELRTFHLDTGQPLGLKIVGLDQPTGVAYDPRNNLLFIVEQGAGRLRIFSAHDGQPAGLVPALSGAPVPVLRPDPAAEVDSAPAAQSDLTVTFEGDDGWDRLVDEAVVDAKIWGIPVMAGFLSHGDSPDDIAALDKWFREADRFTAAHPKVSALLTVLELGGPFLNDLLEKVGCHPGQLVARAQEAPEDVERVIRPQIEKRAMPAVMELMDGWINQLQAGKLPSSDKLDPWVRRLFYHLHARRQKGLAPLFVVEQPSFESWWRFVLALEREALAIDRFSRGSLNEERLRRELISAGIEKLESADSRDDAQMEGLLVLRLKEWIGQGKVDPGKFAILVPRGRMHARRAQELLKKRFREVRAVRMEELSPQARLSPVDQYLEAVREGHHRPRHAPPEIEQLLDQAVEDLRQKLQSRQSGLEEADEPAAGMPSGDLEAALKWLSRPEWIDLGRADLSRVNPLQRSFQFSWIMDRAPAGWPGEDTELAALTGFLASKGIRHDESPDANWIQEIRRELISQASQRARLEIKAPLPERVLLQTPHHSGYSVSFTGMGMDPEDGFVFLADEVDGVRAYNRLTGREVSLPLNGPQADSIDVKTLMPSALAVAPKLARFFVAESVHRRIRIFNYQTGQRIRTIDNLSDLAGIFYEPATGLLFVAQRKWVTTFTAGQPKEYTLTAYDPATGQAKGSIEDLRKPKGVAVDPATKTLLVLEDSADMPGILGRLRAFDLETLRPTNKILGLSGEITGFNRPIALAYDPKTHYAYILEEEIGTSPVSFRIRAVSAWDRLNPNDWQVGNLQGTAGFFLDPDRGVLLPVEVHASLGQTPRVELSSYSAESGNRTRLPPVEGSQTEVDPNLQPGRHLSIRSITLGFDYNAALQDLYLPQGDNLHTFDAATGRMKPAAFRATTEMDSFYSVAHDRKEGVIFTLEPSVLKIVSLVSGQSPPAGWVPVIRGLDEAQGLLYDPARKWLFVAEKTQVRIFNARDGNVIRVISDLLRPVGMALSPDGNLFYVAEMGGDHVREIPVATSDLRRVISSVESPAGIALDSANKLLYVALNKSGGGVEIVDLRTHTKKPFLTGLSKPWGLVLAPQEKVLIVSERGAGLVRAFSTVNGRPAALVPPKPGVAGLEEAADLEAALARLAGAPAFVEAGRSHLTGGAALQRVLQFERIMGRSPKEWPDDDAELAALTGWLVSQKVPSDRLLAAPDIQALRLQLVNVEAVPPVRVVAPPPKPGPPAPASASGRPFKISGLQNPGGIAYNPKWDLVYVSETSTGRVRVFDGTTGEHRADFIGFDTPMGLSCSPGDDSIYVVEQKPGSLQILRIDSASQLNSSSIKGLLKEPVSVVYDRYGENYYVAEKSLGRVRAVETARKQIDNMRLGGPNGIYINGPEGMALDVDPADWVHRRHLFVAESYDGRVRSFDVNTGRTSGFEILGLGFPRGIALDSQRRRLYVAEQNAARLRTFDADTGQDVGPTIENLLRPSAVALDTAKERLFVVEAMRGDALPDGTQQIKHRVRAFSAVDGKPIRLPQDAKPDSVFDAGVDFELAPDDDFSDFLMRDEPDVKLKLDAATDPDEEDPDSAGLEEGVGRAMAGLAEAAVGPGAVAIDATVFADHAGLEELVKRLPLPGRVVVVGDPSDSFLQEIRARNPEVRWAAGLEEAVTTLLSMAPAESVRALGSASFTEGLASGLGLFGIQVAPLDLGTSLRAFLLAVGLEENVLDQIDWDSAVSALRALEAA